MIGRLVALKTRRFDLVYEKKDLQFIVNKFFEEARIAGNLIHPNIVTIYDVGQDGDYCYIAMELLEGDNLTVYNKKEALLPPEEVYELIKKTCLALDFAHTHNVIHRDVKPANLMYTKDGLIKITDFGIAMTLRTENTAELEVMGTPSYMSPEQTKGLKLTNQTDFFSLGIVFYELLCGRRPFRGRTLYELMDNIRYAAPPSIQKYNADIPPGVDMVIQQVLEKEPEQRYRSGAEMVAELEEALKGKKIPVRDIKSVKKADLLKSVDFFRSFSKREIEGIVRFGKFIRYDKSQVILREGDVDTTFFILLHGRVRVIKNNRKIADLPVGACFGEMGAFTRTARTAHVIAREPCIVLKLDLKVLEREQPELKAKFYQVFMETLIQRLEETTKRLSAEKRESDSSESTKRLKHRKSEGRSKAPEGKPERIVGRETDTLQVAVRVQQDGSSPQHAETQEAGGEQEVVEVAETGESGEGPSSLIVHEQKEATETGMGIETLDELGAGTVTFDTTEPLPDTSVDAKRGESEA
jgi:serine/threonine-protein kinase